MEFIDKLRQTNIPISSRETIEAFRAVEMVGVEDRTTLKNTLALILSKNEEEKARFHQCFDRFFSVDAIQAQQEEAIKKFKGDQPDFSVLITPYFLEKPSTPFSSNSILGRLLLSGDRHGLRNSIERAGKAVSLKSIRSPLERSSYVRLIIEHMGIEDLDRECNILLGKGTGGNWAAQQNALKLKKHRDELLDTVNTHVEQQLLRNHQQLDVPLSEDFLKAIKLTSLEKWLYQELERIVRKMAQQLATLHSRRKKTARHGRLDMQKTLRYNLKYGGSLYELHWKTKRVERPKIVALCDVSHSVGTMSRFFLMFIYCMHEILPNLRTFAFSSYLEEVTDLFAQVPLDEAFPEILKNHSLGLTDYGAVLTEFHTHYLDAVDGRTIIFILGDGRNSGKNPKSELLKTLNRRCKQLFWLNPESRSRWTVSDSEMSAFLPYCHHAAACNSLQHLEHLFTYLLRKNF